MILTFPCIAKALLISGLFFHGLYILHCGLLFAHDQTSCVLFLYVSKESADRACNSFANSEHWYSFDTFIHQYNYPALPGAPARMD